MATSEEALRSWLVQHLSVTLKVAPDQIDIDAPFADYGLDSVETVTLTGELEVLTGRRLSPTLAWDFPSIRRLAAHLAHGE